MFMVAIFLACKLFFRKYYIKKSVMVGLFLDNMTEINVLCLKIEDFL